MEIFFSFLTFCLTPHRWALALGMQTGMRRGELYGLKWSHVSLQPRQDAPNGLPSIRENLICGVPDEEKTSKLGNIKRGEGWQLPRRSAHGAPCK